MKHRSPEKATGNGSIIRLSPLLRGRSVSKLVPISRQSHAGLRWRRPWNFRFTAADHVIPLGLNEVRKAVSGLPTGFMKLPDKYLLIAIQGLRNGENLVVNEAGEWLASHLPEFYTGFPFRMKRIDADRFQVCMVEGSDFVAPAENVSSGEKGWRPFFDEEGKLESFLDDLIKKMQAHASDLLAAERAAAKLTELDLFQAWNINTGDEENPLPIRGLYTIDQERLGRLDGGSLAALRDCGALSLVYAQLFSGTHMAGLMKLGRGRWRKSTERELDFDQADDGGSISFDNL